MLKEWKGFYNNLSSSYHRIQLYMQAWVLQEGIFKLVIAEINGVNKTIMPAMQYTR